MTTTTPPQLPTVCGQPYQPNTYNALHINGCRITINARYTDDDPGKSFVYELGVSRGDHNGSELCRRHNVPAAKLERLVTELTAHLNRNRHGRSYGIHCIDDGDGNAFAVIRDRTADPDVFTALAWAFMIDYDVECRAVQSPRWTTYRCEQDPYAAAEHAWTLAERPPGRGVWTGALAVQCYHREWDWPTTQQEQT